MLSSILGDLICHLFEEELDKVGRWQGNKPKEDRYGLTCTLELHENYSKERGYINADLVIYGYTNYISVFTRIRSHLAPVKRGKICGEYKDVLTPWEMVGHHDSCWRDAVRDFFYENEKKAAVLGRSPFKNGFFKPYCVVSKVELLEAGVPLKREHDDEQQA